MNNAQAEIPTVRMLGTVLYLIRIETGYQVEHLGFDLSVFIQIS